MTKKRIGDPWMTAEEYGRSLPRLSVNLIVRDVARALPFYEEVLGAKVRYADADFAALSLESIDFMLHADHTYDHHAIAPRLAAPGPRGTGAEIRVFGVDPDALEARARSHGAQVVQPAGDRGHGWRDVMVADTDGYVWAVGVPLPK